MPAASASRLLSWWPVMAHLQGCRDAPRARMTMFVQDGSSSTSRTTVDWTKKTLPIFAADGVRTRKIPQMLACRTVGVRNSNTKKQKSLVFVDRTWSVRHFAVEAHTVGDVAFCWRCCNAHTGDA